MVAWLGLVGVFPGVTIAISDRTISASHSLGATAGYKLDSAGLALENINGTSTSFESWCSHASVTGNYEVLATLSSGTSPSGSAVGSWLSLSSTREWYLTNATTTAKTCTLSIQIRGPGGVTLDTATISLSAVRTIEGGG